MERLRMAADSEWEHPEEGQYRSVAELRILLTEGDCAQMSEEQKTKLYLLLQLDHDAREYVRFSRVKKLS
jgi:hypothetical protein